MNEEHRSGFIALIGRPNAGKSTLLNYLVGQKIAITSDKPQTTRNKIAGIVNGEGWQMVLLDTPGVHKPKDRLGEQMVKTALNTLSEVDVIYYIVDATVPFGTGEAYLLEKLKNLKTPVFLLLNKIDMLEKTALLPLIDLYRKKLDCETIVPISALSGDNIDSLLKATLALLPEGPQYYPAEYVTDQPERIIIAEMIREKVIQATREEVPHAVAVGIDLIERRSEEMMYVGATIYVERDSQKGIIIGKKGEVLKTVGSRARKDIEKMLGNKVFLELWVKVKADWRNRDNSLQEFGYKE